MKGGISVKCAVVTRDRTVLLDENYTIRDAIDEISKKGYEISLRRTFQLYGLKYVEERSFTSRYKQEFCLSKSKTLYDIKLKELRIYRDALIGFPIQGIRT